MLIRKLIAAEAALVEAHLLRLDSEDRRLRFFGAINDDAIRGYCRRKERERAVLLGAFIDGALRGAAELVVSAQRWPVGAEIALSVDKPFQGRGVGDALLRAALLMARNRLIPVVHIVCLAEHRRMRRLIGRYAATMRVGGAEVEGMVHPLPPSGASLLREAALSLVGENSTPPAPTSGERSRAG